MYVAVSRFVIANRMAAEVREAFRQRPRKVDEAAGFVRMAVMNPVENEDEVWLMTWWRDEASFRAWHHGHGWRDSHQGMPPGLKLVPGSTELRGFEMFAD